MIIPSLKISKVNLSDNERKLYIKLTNYAVFQLLTKRNVSDENFPIIFDNYIQLLDQSNLEQFWQLQEEMINYLKIYNSLHPELFQQFMEKLILIKTKDGLTTNYYSITNFTVYFFGDKIPIKSSINASLKFLNSWKKTTKEDDQAIPDCFKILIEFLSIFKGNVDQLSEQFLKSFNNFIENWSVEKNKYSSDAVITIVKYITKIADESSTFLTKNNFKTFMDIENILFQKIRKAIPSDKLFCSKCKSVIRHECINAVSSQIIFMENIKELNLTDWCFMKDFKSNIRLIFLYMKEFKCLNANSIKNRFFNQIYNLMIKLNDNLIDEKKIILEILYKNQENVINAALNNDTNYLKYLRNFENSPEKKLILSAYIFILLSDKIDDKSRDSALYDFIYYYSVWLKDHGSIIDKLGKPGTIFHGFQIPNYCIKEILYNLLQYDKQQLCKKLIYCFLDDLLKLETDPVKIAKYLMFLPQNSSQFIDVQKKLLKQLDSEHSLYLGVINYRIYLNGSRELTTCDLKMDNENIENLMKIVISTMDKENELLIYLNDSLNNFQKFIKFLNQNSISTKEAEIAVATLIGVGNNFHSRGLLQEAALIFGLMYKLSSQFKIEIGKLKSISYFAENYNSIPYFQYNFPYDMKLIIKKYSGIVFNNIQNNIGELQDNLICFMNIAFYYIQIKEINSALFMLKFIRMKLKETHDKNNLNILEAKFCWMEILMKMSIENIADTENPIRLGRLFMNSIQSISSIANSDNTLVRNLLFKSVEEFTIFNQELLTSEDTSSLLFMIFKYAVRQHCGLMAVKILLLLVDFNLKHEFIDKSVVSCCFFLIFLFLLIFFVFIF